VLAHWHDVKSATKLTTVLTRWSLARQQVSGGVDGIAYSLLALLALLAGWLDEELAAGRMAVLARWRDFELASGLTAVLAHRRDSELAAGLTAMLARCSLAQQQVGAGADSGASFACLLA
jgi:hypothetical protein